MLNWKRADHLLGLALIAGLFLLGLDTAAGQERQVEIETYGSMHETIGQQQHQGRVKLVDVTRKPHFYAVGALEQLRGEISIFDGEPIVTSVGQDGKLQSRDADAERLQATLLVGGSVAEWKEVRLNEDVAGDDFDQFICNEAEKLGVDTRRPFLFLMSGEFRKVHLHVINGACPVHARLRNKSIAETQKPFEEKMEQVSGKLIGVFARNAVGKLTHPATSVHAHLVFEGQGGWLLTGHLEQVSVGRGTTLLFPMTRIAR